MPGQAQHGAALVDAGIQAGFEPAGGLGGMLIDRRLVGFGLFLITLGGVMVAVRQGLLGEGVA